WRGPQRKCGGRRDRRWDWSGLAARVSRKRLSIFPILPREAREPIVGQIFKLRFGSIPTHDADAARIGATAASAHLEAVTVKNSCPTKVSENLPVFAFIMAEECKLWQCKLDQSRNIAAACVGENGVAGTIVCQKD